MHTYIASSCVADHRLEANAVKLVASETLRAIGELAAGLFHELHTSLNLVNNGALPLGQRSQIE